MKKIAHYFSKHKIISLIMIAILSGGGYYYYKSNNVAATPNIYTIGTVSKGMISTTVSGSGQVSAENEVSINPKISADITSIKVKAGQNVKAGDLLMELSTKDLSDALKQAKNSLDIAKANLDLKLAGLTSEEIAVSKNSVESSKISYQNSIVNLENVKKTAEQSLKKAQLAVTNAQLALDNAQRQYDDNLSSKDINSDSTAQSIESSYNNAKISLNSSLLSLRSAYSTANNILNMDNIAVRNRLGLANIDERNLAYSYLTTAKNDMDSFEQSYNKVSSDGWSQAGVEDLLKKSLVSLQSMKNLEHSTYNVLNNTVSGNDITQASIDSYKSNVSSQESAMVSSISSIQSATQSIANAKISASSSGLSSSGSVSNSKSSLVTAKNNLISAQDSLAQTQLDNKKNIESAQSDVVSKKLSYDSAQAQHNLKIAKPREVDIASLRTQVSQALNSYDKAQDNLNEASVKSPIDGVVASVSQKVGEQAEPSTAAMTIITKKKIATITLNEVDIAKIKTGQRATLTFSAIDGLNITGNVAEIDIIGTVSQGVVSYSAKIGFDTDDDRIKPQMSVAATIITEDKSDVVLAATSAIKTDNSGNSYVEVLGADDAKNLSENNLTITTSRAVEKKYITIGLSNDDETEITDGLSVGDYIIIKTTKSTAPTTNNATQRSGLNMLGGGMGGARR